MVAQDFALHDVWASTLDAEYVNFRKAALNASYVVSCIKFPGLSMTPLGTFFSREQFVYQQLLVNVNALKPIQFGFTFICESPRADISPQIVVFQFNLHFDVNEDMFTEEAMKTFEEAGYDFQRHNTDGISLSDFGELLATSGLVAKKLQWASFHSAFDFGFLVRALNGGSIPSDVRLFYKFFRAYFKTAYDIQALLRHPALQQNGLRPNMSLHEVAEALNVTRWGGRHFAASDSVLAAQVFLKLKNLLGQTWPEVSSKLTGFITGIGHEPILPQGAVIQTVFAAKSSQNSNATTNNNNHDGIYRNRPFSSISSS